MRIIKTKLEEGYKLEKPFHSFSVNSIPHVYTQSSLSNTIEWGKNHQQRAPQFIMAEHGLSYWTIKLALATANGGRTGRKWSPHFTHKVHKHFLLNINEEEGLEEITQRETWSLRRLIDLMMTWYAIFPISKNTGSFLNNNLLWVQHTPQRD